MTGDVEDAVPYDIVYTLFCRKRVAFSGKIWDNRFRKHKEGYAMKKIRDILRRFSDAMGDVFTNVLLGLLLMALGYGLLSLFG